MKFHASSGEFTVPLTDLKSAAGAMYYAIAKIRQMSKKPLTRYERSGALQPCDHAMKAIIEAAEAMGIDLGARWGNELDVTAYAN